MSLGPIKRLFLEESIRRKKILVSMMHPYTKAGAMMAVSSVSKDDDQLCREMVALIKERIENPDCMSVRWMIGMLFDDRNGVKKKLRHKHIQTGDIFTPLNTLPFIKDTGEFPISNELYNKGLLLPSGYNLTEEEIIGIKEAIEC